MKKNIIPKVLEFVTGKTRYKRNMPWFKDSITGNAFRLYERIFWRKKGVRIEAAKHSYRDEDGKLHEVLELHTFEALVINTEYVLRAYLKGVYAKARATKVSIRFPNLTGIFDTFVPQFVFEGIKMIPNQNNPEGYAFAVTFGNTGVDEDQASGTTSFNNNGDFMFTNVNSTSNDISAAAYNGSVMTQLSTSYQTAWSSRYHSSWYKTAPANGANNLVFTGGANWQIVMFSASGTDQTTPVTDHILGSDTTAANPTITVTTTHDNAFPIAVGQLLNSSPTAGANTTNILNGPGGANYIFRSTSAKTPAGAFTINITGGSAGYRLRGFALNEPIIIKTAKFFQLVEKA